MLQDRLAQSNSRPQKTQQHISSFAQIFQRHEGQVVTRKMLCEHVWGFEWDGPTNVIEVHITRLRKKLDRDGQSRIRTVRGRGYSIATV